MEFVKSLEQIKENIITLERYKTSPVHHQDYIKLIKKGLCFVVFEKNGQYSFGPSRFLGYCNNTLQKHINNHNKDGRETNPEISKIVGEEPQYNDELERMYIEYCVSLGFKPENRKRKYWLTHIENDVHSRNEWNDIEDASFLDISENEITETEREQIIKSRIGQSTFKKALLTAEKKCSLCGVSDERFLVASHIKPWSQSNHQERLDVNNGLLLCPNHDSLFDKGYISFDEDGTILISNSLSMDTKVFLNINENMKVKMDESKRKYMRWHLRNVYIKIKRRI